LELVHSQNYFQIHLHMMVLFCYHLFIDLLLGSSIDILENTFEVF